MDITSSQLYIKEILSVTKRRSPEGYTHCKCRHSDCFVYILTGEADYTFGSKSIKAEPGNVLYLSKNSEYKIEITHPNYSYYYFDFIFDNSDGTNYDCNIFKNELTASLESDFINLYKKWHLGSIADKTSCMSVVYGIYSTVISSTTLSYISPSRKNDIDLAVGLIHNNLSNAEFAISDIADKIGVSEVHLRRLFKKTHSTSPIKYLTYLRIEKAKELLRTNGIQITEIAQRCGFASSYYFTRVFKAETGFTPTQYRSIIVDYI